MNLLNSLHLDKLAYIMLVVILMILAACAIRAYAHKRQNAQTEREAQIERDEQDGRLTLQVGICLRVIEIALAHCKFYAHAQAELVAEAKELLANAQQLHDTNDLQALGLLERVRTLLLKATPGLPMHIVNAMTPPGRNQFTARNLLELTSPEDLQLLEEFIARYPSLRLAS